MEVSLCGQVMEVGGGSEGLDEFKFESESFEIVRKLDIVFVVVDVGYTGHERRGGRVKFNNFVYCISCSFLPGRGVC